MSSHSHSHTPGHARPASKAPWLIVGALIAGAVVVGIALIVGNLVLLILGVLVILVGVAGAMLSAHRGDAPLSFTQEFPEHTIGPRGTTGGDSGPPIDTQPHRPPGPAQYQRLEEVDAAEMAEPPDDRRVFPQYSNLGPDERLRNVDGREVIERAEADESVHTEQNPVRNPVQDPDQHRDQGPGPVAGPQH